MEGGAGSSKAQGGEGSIESGSERERFESDAEAAEVPGVVVVAVVVVVGVSDLVGSLRVSSRSSSLSERKKRFLSARLSVGASDEADGPACVLAPCLRFLDPAPASVITTQRELERYATPNTNSIREAKMHTSAPLQKHLVHCG